MISVAPARRRAIHRRLLSWYDAGHRDLPWRFPQGEADPYRVWLAEVMLQQTQVATAIPYYQRFLDRYPTLESLAAAADEEVFALWAGLGYYARCRNLLAAAREALRRHGGLPGSVEALRELPGFGPYTAGAVASIAFGLPEPVVDGNVARVLCRLFALEGDPAGRVLRGELWRIAAELVRGAGEGDRACDAERPGDLNQALMDLGATLCGPARPACARCPLARSCEARRQGRQEELPRPRVRPVRSSIMAACALIERGGELLLVRRTGGGLFAGLWGLPSVELPPGDGGAERALREELRQGLGARVTVRRQVAEAKRTLTHRDLTLRAYPCRLEGKLRPTSAEIRWVRWDQVSQVGISSAMRDLLSRVAPAGAGRAAQAPSQHHRVRPGRRSPAARDPGARRGGPLHRSEKS